MRRRKALLLCLAVAALLCVGFGPPVLTEDAGSGLRLAPWQIAALVAWGNPPDLSAEAALLADETTGQVLLEKNARQRRAVASTTKIMTALVVLERARLDEQVVVSPAAAYTGGNMVGLAPGERLSVWSLLHGLLLNSGNDAATALAEHVAGSVSAFAELMNAKVQVLGMADTHFVNPHGLDAEGHYSTAYDLWLLTREAMRNPVFREIVTKSTWTEGTRTYVNLNQLLLRYPGADGVKTGTSDAAGECLVASATRRGHRLVAVVLHSQDRYADAAALLDYGFAAYDWLLPRLQGEALNRLPFQGQTCRLTMPEAPELLVLRWEAPLLHPFRAVAAQGGGELAAEWWLYRADDVVVRAPVDVRCQAVGEGGGP